jgi:hypothetical protein
MHDLTPDITSSYILGKNYFLEKIKSGKMPVCSVGYVSGSCKSGHRYAAVQFCGKEYCSDCGRDGSPIHQRRVNKWFTTVKSWDTVGYLVVTIPEDYRHYFYSKLILKDFRGKLLRLLKEKYKISKGLARYHFFGDCKPCQGRGCFYCKSTGTGTDFYPHLNILIQSGYIENLTEYLKPLQSWVKLYFKKLIKQDLDTKYRHLKRGDDQVQKDIDSLLDCLNQLKSSDYSLVINYSYVKGQAKMMNTVKYITRSTFRQYHKKTVKTLYNFRNSVKWGWKKTDQVDIEENTDLCPICSLEGKKQQVHWHRLKKFDKNQYLTHYEGKKRTLSAISTADRDLHSALRSRNTVPIIYRQVKGKIPQCSSKY